MAFITAIALTAVVLPTPEGPSMFIYKLIKDEIYIINTNFFRLSDFSKKYFSYLSSITESILLFSSISSFNIAFLIFVLISI